MKNIDVGLLHTNALRHRFTMGLAANLSQHGHKIHSSADLNNFIKLPDDTRVSRLVNLPHPTIQKLCSIEMVFIGVSRRFLAQITRHQNEIKFISSSFQYGDHSSEADFTVPIEIERASHDAYLEYESCMLQSFMHYKKLVDEIGRDAAGYLMPQATRCSIFASATPYEWKHIISQRICKRNTSEMRFVMLLAWQLLYKLDPVFFGPDTVGPFCFFTKCPEGKMSCGNGYDIRLAPDYILKEEFAEYFKKESKEEK